MRYLIYTILIGVAIFLTVEMLQLNQDSKRHTENHDKKIECLVNGLCYK